MKATTILTRIFFAGSLALMLGVFIDIPDASASMQINEGAKCLDGNRQMCKNAELIYYWV